MTTRPIFRVLTVGLCAAMLPACGDDGSNVSSASGSQSAGNTTGDTSDTQGTGTTEGGGSNSNSNTDQPTTGMGGSDSESTTGTTEALTSSSGTTTTGVEPVCGNGIPEAGEECDDGNPDAGDGCEPDCTVTPGMAECGNGTVEAGEACDDGNTMDGDECSADCQVMTPPAECGNGQTEAPEECDDGNQVAGDGCEPNCTLTPAAMCGNGIVDPGEQCDDGNMVDGGPGDTCKNDCTNYMPPQCQAPADYISCDEMGNDIFKAMGLNCSNNPAETIPITNPVITAPDAASYRVATHFGTAMDPMNPGQYMWGPREGQRMLVIGTGLFPALQGDGGLVEQNGNDSQSNGNPDNQNDLPGVMTHQVGSNNGNGGTPFMNCDGQNDCSDTLDAQWNLPLNPVANDVFYMSFDLTVPAGTFGYLFDFVYFSEEWPNYVDSSFNDMFVVWSTSETFTGNVTFINDQPLTVTALDPYMTIQPGNALLAGTGFPGDTEGAATGWFTAKASAAPGETFTVAITVFDMGDSAWDTVGIIDNFRWDCEGCIPSEIDDCGISPM